MPLSTNRHKLSNLLVRNIKISPYFAILSCPPYLLYSFYFVSNEKLRFYLCRKVPVAEIRKRNANVLDYDVDIDYVRSTSVF